jgi:hypothetical protein
VDLSHEKFGGSLINNCLEMGSLYRSNSLDIELSRERYVTT